MSEVDLRNAHNLDASFDMDEYNQIVKEVSQIQPQRKESYDLPFNMRSIAENIKPDESKFVKYHKKWIKEDEMLNILYNSGSTLNDWSIDEESDSSLFTKKRRRKKRKRSYLNIERLKTKIYAKRVSIQ